MVDHNDYRVLYISPSYEKVWGQTCESLLENPTAWLEAIVPEDRERVLAALENQHRTGEFDEEFRIVRPDKSLRWIHDRAFPIRNAQGEIYRLVGIALDITARKRAEIALQEAHGELEQRVQERTQQLLDSEKRLQTMIERAPDSVVYVKQDGTIELVNQQTEEIFGYDHAELIGLPLEVLLPERVRNQHRQHQTGFFKEPRVRPMGSGLELNGRQKDGSEFPVEISLSFMELEKGVVGCATIRDITHRRETQEKLEKTQKELFSLSGHLIQAGEKERRRLALELHDQLGQELALLSIEIEQLNQKAPESQAQPTERLQELALTVRKLSSQVQALSHQLHPSQLTHLGLVVASRSLCNEVSKGSGIEIDFSHSDVPDSIPQDVSICFYRVLQESLSNMVKHSGAGEAQVELTARSSEIQLHVCDSGVGFDPEGHRETFGLGLISMRERVNLIGGELVVESQPSGGTRIKACVSLNSKH